MTVVSIPHVATVPHIAEVPHISVPHVSEPVSAPHIAPALHDDATPAPIGPSRLVTVPIIHHTTAQTGFGPIDPPPLASPGQVIALAFVMFMIGFLLGRLVR